MSSITPNHTVEDVLKTTEIAFNEYLRVSELLSSDASALSLLSTLGLALGRLRDRFKYIVDDDEVLERLQSITIGDAEKHPFLDGLNMDMRATCLYLQDVGTGVNPVGKKDTNVYIQTLDRYAGVLKVVQKKNMKDIVQSIQAEVVHLNEALAAMHSHFVQNSGPSEDQMLARLDCLNPVLSAFHDSRGAAKPCEEGTRDNTLFEIFTWLNSPDQSQDYARVFWIQGYGRNWFPTSAIAQSVATQAHQEGRLLASFFSSSTWSKDPETRDPANLIPTIIYQLARFDRDYLRRITHAMSVNREIRDKDAKAQISVLLEEAFKDAEVPSGPSPLIVIDSLDAFEYLNDPAVTQDMSLYMYALTEMPLRAKILITSLYSNTVEPVVNNPHFPAHQVHMLRPSQSEIQADQARDQANADWAARNGLSVFTPQRSYATPRNPPRRYDGRPGQIVRLGT